MCQYYSFAVDVLDPRVVYVGDGYAHDGIEAKYCLKPGDYRECEWTGDGPETLVVRGESANESKVLRDAILGRWGMRAKIVSYLEPKLAAYDKAVASARAAYNKATAPARAAYDKAVASVDAAYSKALASARAAYDKALASARAAYNKATAPARAAYDKAVASADAAYDKAVASARAAYNKATAPARAAYKKSVIGKEAK